MNSKKYERPEMEITVFEAYDIITTSGDGPDLHDNDLGIPGVNSEDGPNQ